MIFTRPALSRWVALGEDPRGRPDEVDFVLRGPPSLNASRYSVVASLTCTFLVSQVVYT